MSTLALAKANKIIEVALAIARQKNYRPMAVVVLDEAGHIRALQREDGASMFRIEIATGKAWAAVGMGASSRVLHERAKENSTFFGALPAASQGKFLAQPGAVLIKGPTAEVLGAVGASGGTGDEDEAICIAGVEAAGYRHA
jgi:uncharacterized protein GlcG (DUF336 family)